MKRKLVKRNRKPNQIVEKGQFEENENRQTNDDRLKNDNSRTKLKEVKSNPMDHDQRTP